MAVLGVHFLHDLIAFLFAVTGGLTLSGISANAYRLLAGKPEKGAGRVLHYAVMAIAGPTVLIGNATRSFRRQSCSDFAYVIAVAVAGYWAFLLGLGLLSVVPYL